MSKAEKSKNLGISQEDAARVMQEAEQKRVDACSMAIDIALQKYSCIIIPVTIIEGRQVSQRITIRVNPMPNQPPLTRIQTSEEMETQLGEE